MPKRKGLRKAARHNGKRGTVLHFSASKGRYAVELGGGKQLLVRRANLEKL